MSGSGIPSGSIFHPYLFDVLGEATLLCHLRGGKLETAFFSRDDLPVTEANYPESLPKWLTTPSVGTEEGSGTGTPDDFGDYLYPEGTLKPIGNVSPITPLNIVIIYLRK